MKGYLVLFLFLLPSCSPVFKFETVQDPIQLEWVRQMTERINQHESRLVVLETKEEERNAK